MTRTDVPRSGRGATVAALLMWVAVIWGAGVWQGWWRAGPRSIAIAVVIALLVVVPALFRLPPPSPATVRVEVDRLLHRPQLRKLRHLVYHVATDWRNQRADDEPWTGMKFLLDPLGLILRVGVSPILDEENRTPALMQAYARHHYENQLGTKVVRNEITTFAGHWCVVTEAAHANGSMVRHLGFTLHLSEYVVQFTFSSQGHLDACVPLMDAFVGLCRLELPQFVDRSVLGGKVQIGIPLEWTQTLDEDRRAAWRGQPGLVDVRLDLLAEEGPAEVDERVFETVAGFERPPGSTCQEIRMDENGVSGLRLVWSPPARRVPAELVVDAVRLPTGQVVALSTWNRGTGDEMLQGFTVDTMRLELLASLRPGGTEIL
jgi:hypothetical protein